MPRHRIYPEKETPILCGNCVNFKPHGTHPCELRQKIPHIYCRRQIKINKSINTIVCASNLPNVQQVRKAIESIKEEKYRIYMMTIYLCGAARACEIAYKRSMADINNGYTINYGPYGDDCWLDETDPPDPKWIDVLEMLLSIQVGTISIKDAITKAKQKIPVAIFKIKIAKTHIIEGEDPPYRLVALPLPEKYEPWTQIIYNYFQNHKGQPVFNFNRSDVCDYLSRVDKVFEGMYYRIKKYTYNNAKDEQLTKEKLNKIQPDLYDKLLNTSPNKIGIKVVIIEEYEYRMDYYGKIYRRQIYKVLSHPKPLKIHGLRHIRTDELLKYKAFDGVDLVAYVGWSGRGVALPTQASNYAEIRENWQRYIKKLCVIT